MTVKLNCSSSGSVALSAPASTALGADVVLNLPSHAGSLDRLERAGNILQVVNATTGTLVSNTNTTYVDTTLSASITPTSASSKILVLVNQAYYMSSSSNYMGNGVRVLRGSTVIYQPNGDETGTVGDYDFYIGGGSSNSSYGRGSITLLDSPNTTSATTYKTQGRSYGVSTVTYQIAEAYSTITLLEVAA
tara:strand:- start:92 stop:664 length:573 start_codon:yes stop_codon:yes gene_type:complete